MTEMTPTAVVADFSPERRAQALAVIARSGLLQDPHVFYEARLLYAVSLLICDEDGRLPKDAAEVALTDPSIVQAARALLREARRL